MGILIKGMEMPKDGDGVFIDWHGNVSMIGDEIKAVPTAHAVELPPHGRLVEKHDVFRLISAFPEIDKLLTVEFMQALYNLPTIIPAEEGE